MTSRKCPFVGFRISFESLHVSLAYTALAHIFFSEGFSLTITSHGISRSPCIGGGGEGGRVEGTAGGSGLATRLRTVKPKASISSSRKKMCYDCNINWKCLVKCQMAKFSTC